MRTLLLGANGLLGRDLVEALSQSGCFDIIAATRDGRMTNGVAAERVELGSEVELDALLECVRPQLIINAAAYTAVDRAEGEEALAMRINGDVPGQLGRWAAAHQALVVHYSTDYVFDGQQKSPYLPDSATAPLGVYGRSKLAGERTLQASGAAHLVFRTAWLYGSHGKNFPRTILALAKENAALRVVDDQHGTPTSARRVATSTRTAIDRWQRADVGQRIAMQGVHHLVASGATSWHGFASAVVECAAEAGMLDRAPPVAAVGSDAFPTRARRPTHAVLDNSGFTRTFGIVLPPWQEDLQDFIRQLAATRTTHTG